MISSEYPIWCLGNVALIDRSRVLERNVMRLNPLQMNVVLRLQLPNSFTSSKAGISDHGRRAPPNPFVSFALKIAVLRSSMAMCDI